VSVEDFPYRIRQEPGDGNALGRIKFVLTNPYDIYLHDTPSEHLFARNQRNFSHGCVRVEKPRELAAWLLRDQSQWDAAAIESQIAAGDEKWVKLSEPMPTHLVYWTAWADPDGVVSFRDDVYELDRQLLDVLRGRNPAAPVAASGHGAG
jgi:murein L,D-transpeptidase YcbB/YkuD